MGAAAATAVALVGAPAQAGDIPAARAGHGDHARPTTHTCDPIDPTSCLLPFPNNYFTVPDRSTATGRRVDLQTSAMPQNSSGKRIDPTAWNQSDGFSPGALILTHVPGLDLKRTGAAPITDIGASMRRDAPIVLLDEDTGQRWPYWAELDANDSDTSEQALLIHPARNLKDGDTYVVALRDLRDTSGRRIAAQPAFSQFLHGHPHGRAARERMPQMKKILGTLARHHVGRRGLYLAWDFTVASTQNLTGRMIHMRDTAFRQLGRRPPAFHVDSVTDYSKAQNALISRHITGTFDVPSYLNKQGGPPGSTLNLGRNGLPQQLPGNIQHADFVCNIPRSASTDPADADAPVYPAHPSLYGHGLLGSPTEIDAHNVEVMSSGYDFVFCATSWIGMASGDTANVLAAFQDFSTFDSIPDRSQQGLLDALFLGRLMTSSRGFATNSAFQNAAGTPLINTRQTLAYDGNSQGGIIGGALMAIARHIPRGVLGVTGMNYSTLINRSVDAAPFLQIMDQSYPDKLDQQIIFSLIQMLWDRGEADGYAEHMTNDPLPGTPRHQVLMQVAFGDHQVAPVSAAVEARTVQAAIHRPALDHGRSPDVHPYWGIRTIRDYPYHGSAMTVWDSGTPPVPLTNTPPAGPAYGTDPHEMPRSQPAAQRQKAYFLTTGAVTDVCGAGPCHGVNP